VKDHSAPVQAAVVDVVEPPAYETLERMLEAIAKLY
jgi:hypothetical protein